MRHVTLICREDDVIGDFGFVVKGTPIINDAMVATQGRLIAHDLLEHQRGVRNIGTLGDELLAFGGMWYVRGEYGDLGNGYYSTEQALGNELSSLARWHADGVPLRVPVPKTRATLQDSCYLSAIEYGKKLPLDVYEDADLDGMPAYWDSVIHYLRKGYSMARDRYRDQSKANSMFAIIAKAVDKGMREAEDLGFYEGMVLRLSYGDYKATCRLVEEAY